MRLKRYWTAAVSVSMFSTWSSGKATLTVTTSRSYQQTLAMLKTFCKTSS